MRFVPRPVHGILDYITGLLLLASPWFLGYLHEQPVSADMAMIFGAGMMIYTSLTNFEVGIIRLIPFPGHLVLDCAIGVLLVGSPILFGITGTAAIVFVLVGIFELAVAAMTRGSGWRQGRPSFPSWT